MAVNNNVVPISSVAKPQEAPDPLINVEMGVEKVLPFTFWSSDGEIARESRISLDDLVEMRRRDGQARALIRLFTLPILSAFADGEWIAPDEETDMDKEVEFANQMWNLAPQAGGMTTSKMVLLKKTLQGLTDGFAVFEEVREIPEDGPLKGKITLRKLAYRDPRTIRFRVDDKGGFNGVRQVASINGRTVDVKIPKEKVFYWTCNAEENPFYGVSLFEAAYEHYTVKRKLYYIAHLAAQFAAVPGRMGTIPKGADPRKVYAFKQMLMNFAFNTAGVMEEGFAVDSFNGNSGFDFLKLIDHHNHMMSKSVLSGFLDQEARTTLIDVGGSSDPSTDFFVMALESVMDDIAEQWSSYLMPKYLDWNFGTKKYPIFRFGQLTDTAKDSIKEIFTTMVTSSVLNSTPEFVREMEKKLSSAYDLDVDYEEIEKQEKEAAEAEAKKAEEESKAILNAPVSQAPQPGQQNPGQPAAVDKPQLGQPGAPPAPPKDDLAPLSAPTTLDDLFLSAAQLIEEMDNEEPGPV